MRAVPKKVRPFLRNDMLQIVKHYYENTHKMSIFKESSRFLWNDHVSYTRNIITSILSNLSDIDAISSRLIKNQRDIGLLISPYYSAEQIFSFVDLLKKHIIIAVDVVKGISGAEDSWRSNGNDFVLHMSKMNPMFWPITTTNTMWTDHLDMTISQVNARQSLLWDEDIKVYDTNHQHIAMFADLISTGIIYQNIEDFCLRG